MPLTGFLPASDPRIVSTVDAIRRELTTDGLVRRYETEAGAADGLPPGEGVFLACSFWLASGLELQGRHDEARELFERLPDLRNDVGLLAEEHHPVAGRQLGNFPQAFSRLALVDGARSRSARAARCTLARDAYRRDGLAAEGALGERSRCPVQGSAGPHGQFL